MRDQPHPEVAFVLSGCASLGAVQVGMLRALYERGIAPDLIVGTSAGALNGAFIASRPQTVETADALAAVWRSLRRGQVFPVNPLTGMLGFLGTRGDAEIVVMPPLCPSSVTPIDFSHADELIDAALRDGGAFLDSETVRHDAIHEHMPHHAGSMA